jgi:DNA polymerase elongation subunit (family B)
MSRFLAPKVKALLPDFVVIDFEWRQDNKIYAASFVTEDDEEVMLETEFESHKDFIDEIQTKILDYPVSVGWNTLGLMMGKDSDLDYLTLNALVEGLEPIFDRQYRTVKDRQHIDLMRVFNKKLVELSMFKNRFRDVKLETVSQCFLGRGKSGHGAEAHTYNEKRLREYVLEDSRLVFDLLSVGMFHKVTDEPTFDGALLDTMAAIAKLVKMPFAKVCNGNLSQWWSKIFDEEGAPDADPEFMVRPNDPRYQGGELIAPEIGLYKNVDVLDVQSLYPTMIENFNLSHETVCCACCKDDPKAKVSNQIIPRGYWICQKNVGILARKIREFKAERVKQKKLENTAQAEGLKILLNGAYGLYGSQFFKYSDRRVAELVTALARWTTFKRIKPIAESVGFRVVYGDTDSIFCLKEKQDAMIVEIQAKVKAECNVVLEHEKVYTVMIVSKKKHYMGKKNLKDGSIKVEVKGIEWKKGDRGKWINKTGAQIEEAFKVDGDCLAVVKMALDNLDNNRVPIEDLKVGIRLSKAPEDYKGNSLQKKVGLLTGGTAGNVSHYFKGIGGQPTLDPSKIDKKKYRELLLATCEDVLKIMGYNVASLDHPGVSALDAWLA